MSNSVNTSFEDAKTLEQQEKFSVGPFNNLSLILQSPLLNVFLGDAIAARNLPLLRSLRIAAVVNCANELPNYHEAGEKADHAAGIVYVNVSPLNSFSSDSTEAEEERLLKELWTMFQAVERLPVKATKGAIGVLVHCAAGPIGAGL